jgi:dipeptide/tripeptide permease
MSVSPTAAPAPAKATLFKQVSGLPANFWYANIMEMFERLAFFGVRAIAPLYLVAASSDNGLALDYKQKGLIYTVWALLQCLIPMVSGGYTDRYGYRKSLAVAFTINIGGYLLMARSRPIADTLAAQGWAGGGFWVFMLAACLVATGTAIFKPPVQGTVARATSERTSSLGWGLFYWVVNIGGALAPMLAAILRAEIDWQLVFYGAAVVTLLNFLPAFILYREPERIAHFCLLLADVHAALGPAAEFHQ